MRIEPNNSGRAARGGRHGATRSAPMAEINIVPLVDVILVLLIIFMATTAFVKETGLKMKLPAAQSGQSAKVTESDLTIALAQNGAMTLDGQPTNEKALAAVLKARVRQNPQANVVIKGDQKIEYARIVRIMDLARQSGLKSVGLGTRQPEGNEAQ